MNKDFERLIEVIKYLSTGKQLYYAPPRPYHKVREIGENYDIIICPDKIRIKSEFGDSCRLEELVKEPIGVKEMFLKELEKEREIILNAKYDEVLKVNEINKKESNILKNMEEEK